MYKLLGLNIKKPYRCFITSKDIKTFKKYNFSVDLVYNSQGYDINSQEDCYICLEKLKSEDQNISNFLCNRHYVHKECLSKWV